MCLFFYISGRLFVLVLSTPCCTLCIRVLTVVGELHSLTDWHVSEASDDAELDDFYSRKTEKAQNFVY